MKLHRNTLSILESTWGIIISQEGYVKEFKSFDDELIISKVDNIYLSLPNNQLMSKEYKQFLIDGFRWVKDLINKKNIIVVINQFDINPSNFQIDGLFFSMAQWLSTYYEFNLPYYEVTFNSLKNKYQFKIPMESNRAF